jgi:hypothetical protein
MNGRSAFPVLTLRQAQGERTGKVFSGRASFGFKNGLRALFLYFAPFFAICGEGIKNLTTLSFPNY